MYCSLSSILPSRIAGHLSSFHINIYTTDLSVSPSLANRPSTMQLKIQSEGMIRAWANQVDTHGVPMAIDVKSETGSMALAACFSLFPFGKL